MTATFLDLMQMEQDKSKNVFKPLKNITCPKGINANIYILSLLCVFIISPKLPIKD